MPYPARAMVFSLTLPLLSACGAASEEAAPARGPAEQKHGHEHGGHEHGGHGHGPLVHRFESAEQWAKDLDDPARDAWQRPAEVIAAMQITEGMTVADLGAGTGYFLSYLSRAVGPSGKVLALDIEPDMARYMRERAAREGLANVEVKVVPIDDPALPAGSLDRVLIVDSGRRTRRSSGRGSSRAGLFTWWISRWRRSTGRRPITGSGQSRSPRSSERQGSRPG
jgi:hypothetical protein